LYGQNRGCAKDNAIHDLARAWGQIGNRGTKQAVNEQQRKNQHKVLSQVINHGEFRRSYYL
jgi:hypothetical protein